MTEYFEVFVDFDFVILYWNIFNISEDKRKFMIFQDFTNHP